MDLRPKSAVTAIYVNTGLFAGSDYSSCTYYESVALQPGRQGVHCALSPGQQWPELAL
ncbi:hypothetical protein Bpfe_010371, partial [Biomphalaria pfeifferi]